MAELPTGTVTFLFTDIEGSTRLWENHSLLMPTSLARHDQIVTKAISDSKGHVFKTVGDAFYASFNTAQSALRAALDIQKALATEKWGKTGPIRVRISLHTGTAEERDNDYYGPSVNRVARLLSAGYGGQILVSQATFELIRDELPENVDLLDQGTHQLKDLLRPEHI